MKKFSILFALLVVPFLIEAKTTYIPHYNSYIAIEDADGNVTSENSLKLLVSLFDKDKTFRLSIAQEEMTSDKVKTIKRAKAAAGWQAASAILSSVASLSNGSSSSFQSRLNIANEEICMELADMYAKNAVSEQVLSIEVQFENLSDNEMMLHDMERGLVWFVRPGNSFVIKLHNPDVLQLRISDAKDVTSNVHYARLAAGNSVEKVEVSYETDSYILSVQKASNDAMYITKNNTNSDIYWLYDKKEFIGRRIDEAEYKRLKEEK